MRCATCSKRSNGSLAKVNCCEARYHDECIERHIDESSYCPACESKIRIVIFSDGDFYDLQEEEEEEEEDEEEEEEEEEEDEE